MAALSTPTALERWHDAYDAAVEAGTDPDEAVAAADRATRARTHRRRRSGMRTARAAIIGSAAILFAISYFDSAQTDSAPRLPPREFDAHGRPLAIAATQVDGVQYLLLDAMVPAAGHGFLHTKAKLTIIVDIDAVRVDQVLARPAIAQIRVHGSDGRDYAPIHREIRPSLNDPNSWLKLIYVVPTRAAEEPTLRVFSRQFRGYRAMPLPLWREPTA